jgi:hypothetical protein
LPGVADFPPQLIESHLGPYFGDNSVVRIGGGVKVVEDEVKEFRDRADALKDGLVHGESLKLW